MSNPPGEWRHLGPDDGRLLRGFTCTTDHPRTPGGRRLRHPRPWEWDVQAHLHRLPQSFPRGDSIVGRIDGVDLSACAQFVMDAGTADGAVDLFLRVAAISVAHRGRGGALADELLRRVEAAGIARAEEVDCHEVVLAGNIHLHNAASQTCVARCGWEPVGAPVGTYQRWIRRVTISS